MTGEYKTGKCNTISESTATLKNTFSTYADMLQRQIPTVAISSQLSKSELNHSITLSDEIRQQESRRLKHFNDFNAENKIINEQINAYSNE